MSEVLFCPKCNGEMERGILALLAPEWYKFYPVKYKWEVRNPKNQVLASRCTQCGHTVTYSDSLEKKVLSHE